MPLVNLQVHWRPLWLKHPRYNFPCLLKLGFTYVWPQLLYLHMAQLNPVLGKLAYGQNDLGPVSQVTPAVNKNTRTGC